MKRLPRYLLALVTGALLSAAVLAVFLFRGKSGRMPSSAPSSAALSALLDEYRGRVLVLLLGRDGCPGTARATAALDEWVPTLPPDEVAVLRLDVPLPNENLRLSPGWSHPFPRRLDKGRAVARALGFFFYPTLYVFDPDGVLRFEGGTDTEFLSRVVREILSAPPGAPKKIYTVRQPEPGSDAPGFSGLLLSGGRLDMKAALGRKGLVVLFSRLSCPYTRKALRSLDEQAASWKARGVNTVIVDYSGSAAAAADYEKLCPGVPVVLDTDGSIRTAWGVDTTPFFFLLDADGAVISRRSFTPKAGSMAVTALLNLTSPSPRPLPSPRFTPEEAG